MTAIVRALHRFPVKGFPAEPLGSGEAAPHAGLAGDRVLALADGTAPVSPGSWHSWSAFLALKKRSDLAAWGVRTLPDGRIGLTPPPAGGEGAREEIVLDPAAHRRAPGSAAGLASHLPGTDPAALSVTAASSPGGAQGMFDDEHGHLSLIGLASVRALEEAAGEAIDPLRFRGNLLVDGLVPFAEFGLVGRTVRVGGAVLLIRSTIERCAATKVHPGTAQPDLNVPRLLATALGHIHMGVYGTVLSPGRIAPGDAVEVLAPEQARAHTASPPALPGGTGPRMLRVVDSAALEGGGSDGACHASSAGTPAVRRHHLRLRDPYGWFAAHWRPGMHVRVHLPGPGGPLWRSYTAFLVRGSEFSLLVQERGEASGALAALRPGEQVMVSGPFGSSTPETVLAAAGSAAPSDVPASPAPPSRAPQVAVLTAGVGITTALSLVPGLAAEAEVRCLHVDRGAGRASAEALQRLADAAVSDGDGTAAGCSVALWDTAERGRPDMAALSAFLTGAQAAVLCGGEEFLTLARSAAQAAGLPASALISEAFASPVPEASARIAGRPPARIVRADGRVLDWTAEDGTLLEALEADGARIPFTCRSGSCGTCAVGVRSTGAAEHVLDHTAQPGPGRVLSCCSVPVGELHVDV
ncbi:MOSC domain-containing protein [Brevibacterium album]|uniref:MOSC domain-containing protein n=1 Tax=Brevibacterium album TaxID=417948 RepID=UPI00041F867A|nr:2Fe-2S iron-sulfur cluster-binding protein [Brevibacterium album]